MAKVNLKNATYRGQAINGEFELVTDWKTSERSGDKDGIVRIVLNGSKVNACVNEEDVSYGPVKVESYEDILKRITKRFNILERMTDGIINGSIRALVVAGAAGVGKTFTVERKLKEAMFDNRINFEHIKGRMSAAGLYRTLYLNRTAGNVVVIDDCDGVFGDEDAMNILKSALDTSDERWINWNVDNVRFEAEGIESKFEFKCTVVFITNLNFHDIIEADGRMAPHMSALISRSIYLDLALHDDRAIMARVEDLSLNTTMLYAKGMNEEQIKTTLAWLKMHAKGLLEKLSLRTVLKLAQFVKTESDWEDIAETTLLRMDYVENL